MKKGIIVLLITVLVATSVFALDFHGSFRAGYTFSFSDGVAISDVSRLGDLAGRFSVTSGAEGEGWTLDLWSPNFSADGSYYKPISALLTVDYSTVLGLPEDVSVKMMLGDNSFSIYVPYLDPTTSYCNYIDSVGTGIMTGLSLGYKNFSLTGAIDPDGVSGIVYANADFDFVSVGAGVQIAEADLDVEAGFVFDIANAAKLDNSVASISALYKFNKVSGKHNVLVAVTGGYDAFGAYAEFIAALATKSKEYDLNVGVDYAITDSLSVGADGSFEFDSDKAISGAGWAAYTLNGVTYYASVGYDAGVYALAMVMLSF